MEDVKRILFVDDEQKVLDGLSRMLYAYRGRWQMMFANSGRQALKLLDESEFDLLVTDVRMPDLNGIELLAEVLKRHPQVVRIVLSGTADQELALRSVNLAHQYLVKPCDAEQLRATMERAFHLRVMLNDPALKRVISSIHSLPSLPVAYMELMEALRKPETSANDVGRIVARDVGMAAKVLQLVNSAFFGISRSIADPTEAVVYLGMDLVRDLSLAACVFSQFDTRAVGGFSLESLRDHSLAVAAEARHIASSRPSCRSEIGHSFAAGLLHDIGKLVLASAWPDRYRKVMRQIEKTGRHFCDTELEMLGTTHAEVGAYLLWLWNLPDPIVEAVALHHVPPDAAGDIPCPAKAVYTANLFVNSNGRIADPETGDAGNGRVPPHPEHGGILPC